MCNSEKLKMCKFILTGCMQIICKNVCGKLVQSVSFWHIGLPKAKYYQNLTTESGSKQKCSLLQEKKSHLGSVPEDLGSWHKSRVLDLKGGLRVFRKTQIISTASDHYFLSYVKKTASSPAGIELKCLYKTVCLTP